MNCARFQVAVHEYYRGTLSAAEHVEVETHAGVCPPCGRLKATCEEIACKEVVGFLPEYLEHELAPARKRLFERHFDICPDCSAYLHAYRSSIALAAEALAEPAEAPPLSEELVRALVARAKKPKP